MMSSVLNSKIKSISFKKGLVIIASLYLFTLTLELYYAASPLADKWSGDVFIVTEKGDRLATHAKMHMAILVDEDRSLTRNGKEYEATNIRYSINFSGEEKDKVLMLDFNKEHALDDSHYRTGACAGTYFPSQKFMRYTPDFDTGFRPVLSVPAVKECLAFQLRPDGSNTLHFQGGKEFRMMSEMTREWDWNILHRMILLFKYNDWARDLEKSLQRQ